MNLQSLISFKNYILDFFFKQRSSTKSTIAYSVCIVLENKHISTPGDK